MTRTYRPQRVIRQDRPDGSVLLTNPYPLEHVATTSSDWLHRWAAEAPERVFLAERSGAGWRGLSYGAALEAARAIAAALLDRGMGADTPVMILSGNGIDHGLLTLGAHYAGIPSVPVAEQYSLIPAAHGRLRYVTELVRPAMVFADDGERFGAALDVAASHGVEKVASTNAGDGMTLFAELLKGGADDVDAARADVTPDTVAKILLTSGSTSNPKGVPTTQRMMCTNQAQIAGALPFLRERPPTIVDWLPWNHTFGGSHNFNMMLANGGTLWIDDGKPLPALFPRTLENLRLAAGTLSFNVPVGFAQLLAALREDAAFRRHYFSDLDMIFYAGASLPQDVWQGLEDLARAETGELPLMTSSWGLTETSPGAVIQQVPTRRSGVIGVPMAGSKVKLLPAGDGCYEIRVAGPHVFTGYLNDEARTAAAFDDEGFFRTGDAVRFVDEEAPEAGLGFDGRLSEDFKLMTGTWVRTANLRLEVLGALAPMAADIVLTGEGRAGVGMLIFPSADALRSAGISPTEDAGTLTDPVLDGEIIRRISARNARDAGSSTRVTRAIVLAEPPSIGEGEITAKGNLNFGRVLARRAALIERLYNDDDSAVIRIAGE